MHEFSTDVNADEIKLIRKTRMHEYSSGGANISSKSSTHGFPCDGGSIFFENYQDGEKTPTFIE